MMRHFRDTVGLLWLVGLVWCGTSIAMILWYLRWYDAAPFRTWLLFGWFYWVLVDFIWVLQPVGHYLIIGYGWIYLGASVHYLSIGSGWFYLEASVHYLIIGSGWFHFGSASIHSPLPEHWVWWLRWHSRAACARWIQCAQRNGAVAVRSFALPRPSWQSQWSNILHRSVLCFHWTSV